MYFGKFIVFLFCFFTSQISSATSGHLFNVYFNYLNFGSHYYGEEILQVDAKIGILKENRFRGIYWDQQQQMLLEQNGDYFFGKVEMDSEFHTHYGDSVLGPVIQYSIITKGNKKIKTETFFILIQEAPEGMQSVGSLEDLRNTEAYKTQLELFKKQQDSSRTFCIKVFGGYAS